MADNNTDIIEDSMDGFEEFDLESTPLVDEPDEKQVIEDKDDDPEGFFIGKKNNLKKDGDDADEYDDDDDDEDEPASPWADYVARQLGIDDYLIDTGDEENPVTVDIRQLGDKQLMSILYNMQQGEPQTQSNMSESERMVIEMLRNGNLEELRDSLNEELGIETPAFGEEEIDRYLSHNFSDDDINVWKIKEDYPDFNDEQIQAELDILKSSDNYEAKTKSNRDLFDTRIKNAVEERDNAAAQQRAQDAQVFQQTISEILEQTDNLSQFEIDDEIKGLVYNDLVSEEGDFMSYINTPEGLAAAAMAVRVIPRIGEYVEGLLEQITQLKGKVNKVSPKVVIDETKDTSNKGKVDASLEENLVDFNDYGMEEFFSFSKKS